MTFALPWYRNKNIFWSYNPINADFIYFLIYHQIDLITVLPGLSLDQSIGLQDPQLEFWEAGFPLVCWKTAGQG